jgi:3-hydroxyisobutyrate dehydrogenase-like beta-hydroxyacid dehydrogenase
MMHPMSTRIAFLGLGIMGSRQAANLARAGFDLTVWNRTRATAEAFCDAHGATLAPTPAEAARGAEFVITMVVDGPQVGEVLLGEQGAATTAAPGTIVIDCSTIGPAATHQIAGRLRDRDLRMLDAPVTGSAPRAEDGTLTIMVGGERADFDRARPVFDAMGELIVYAGPQGHGQMVKLLNNAVAASNAAVLGQALVVGAKAGVDLDAVVDVLGAGAGGSTMLTLKAGPMRNHDYTTLFKLEHMLKDVRLCLEEGQALGVPFPSAAFTREILTAAMGLGHADADFAALIEPLEGLGGTRLT